jgi:hypothetical protein
MEENYYQTPTPLPNATVVLVLGILSIPACCCYGIGIVFAIIALVLAKSATDLYIVEPAKYEEGSYKNLNAGKICAWIGLVLSVIYILLMVGIFFYFGKEIFTDPCIIYERAGLDCPF